MSVCLSACGFLISAVLMCVHVNMWLVFNPNQKTLIHYSASFLNILHVANLIL